MQRLGALACTSILLLSWAFACSSDENKKVTAVADAGAGGAGAPGQASGGGSMNEPAAGGAGSPADAPGGAGAGALPELAGAGGMAASSEGGVASAGAPLEGTPAAGAGGMGPDCPAETGKFSYSCGEIANLWAPTYDSGTGTVHFDVSQLPFPVASGTALVFYNGIDSVLCNTFYVAVSGHTVSISLNPEVAVTSVQVADFHFVDVCGNEHDFDYLGAPSCYDIRGVGTDGTWVLSCNSRLDGTCPALCN